MDSIAAESKIETQLWQILNNVNSWLHYAERKNAILLSIIGIQVTLINSFADGLNIWLMVSLGLLGITFLTALISFFPKNNLTQLLSKSGHKSNTPHASDNLLYYGHIQKYSVSRFVAAIEKENYLNCPIRGNKYREDLCAQIIVNSQIAWLKFSLFKQTTWLMILGQVFFLLSLYAPK